MNDLRAVARITAGILLAWAIYDALIAWGVWPVLEATF